MKNRNIYLLITFTALVCWSLWNYSVSLWGIVGMIIGVPAVSLAYALLAGEVRRRLAEKKLDDL